MALTLIALTNFFYFGLTLKESIFYIFCLYILIKALKLLYFFYKIFIRERKNLKGEYGSNTWALVTGATEGIGKAFCEELAIAGFNIILVSRTEDKLAKVACEIREINPEVKVSIIPFNFAEKTCSDQYINSFNEIMDYDISILVNNVGITMKDKFENLSFEEINSYIDLNITPQTMMTKLLFSTTLKRDKKSAIINISSTASNVAAPNRFSLYGATKSFNDYLSLGLGKDTNYKSKIDFMCVKPMMVESFQTNYKANGITVITAKQCVTGSLNCLGYDVSTFGHWIHQIQGNLLTLVPEEMFLFLTSFIVMIMKKNKTK